jgi:AcrR family transcriptional regulator
VDARAPLGLRERGKLEKRQRIREAARAVFREKGFERATTREIAERAGVANATLFAYARDKRDLMMLVVNDDLDAITDAALTPFTGDRPLLDQLIEVFRPRYEYWAADPDFSRHAVQQTFASLTEGESAGPETVRFHARRPKIVAQLTDLVREKQRLGRVGRNVDAESVGWLFMAIYQAEQRQWLIAEKPDVAAGLERLRALFRIVIRGIDAARGEA